ncbi:3-hydroxyacyl-CoA dehydrogenase [Pseudorhodoplanes sp.]|uniref:3-hydroxyacyl-CoA dehydrogenase n=1 Tax=Pseudorhodoplanes sp. TaxID=1934341 RepID=UPI003D117D98
MEQIVSADAILASNTSSLSISRIASACKLPQRCAGLHFFNPVPLMRVVEVVGGVRTSRQVVETLVSMVRQIGHTPIVGTDTPGFIVNHLGRGLYTEGLRVVQERIAPPFIVDRILRETCGFRMGPFELLDLTGLDVSFPVMEQIYRQFYEEPRFRPSPLAARQVAAGLFGRKTDEGFYEYREGQKVEPEVTGFAAEVSDRPIWIGPGEQKARSLITRILGTAGVRLNESETPGAVDACILLPIGTDATTAAIRAKIDARRTVAIDPLFISDKHLTVMPTPVTESGITAFIAHAMQNAGVTASLVQDSPGFIAQRVVATIVNIACDAAQQQIASPSDIDTGARLGLGYPTGPLAWGDLVGAGTVLDILDQLHQFYGDPRYRASPWLRRRAMLNLSLVHEAA